MDYRKIAEDARARAGLLRGVEAEIKVVLGDEVVRDWEEAAEQLEELATAIEELTRKRHPWLFSRRRRECEAAWQVFYDDMSERGAMSYRYSREQVPLEFEWGFSRGVAAENMTKEASER